MLLTVRDGTLDPRRVEAAIRRGRALAVCDCGTRVTGRIDRTYRMWFLTLSCPRCGAEAACPNGRVARAFTHTDDLPQPTPIAA